MNIFSNNSELMAFEKSGWSIVETMEDGTIYMGKPSKPDALFNQSVWTIKRIRTNEKGGIQTIISEYAYKQKWEDRFIVDYRFF